MSDLIWRCLCFLLSFYNICRDIENDKITIIVNSSQVVATFDHFWTSTDPHPEAHRYFMSNDMKQNLGMIGSLPFDSMQQVRVHWLLDLIVAQEVGRGQVTYNFTRLDDFIELLHENDLRPGFELMGNPSDLFDDFENRTQLYLWRDLIKSVAKRYISKYGIEWASNWNFETWNEPDHRDFDYLNITIQGFLNYYDACYAGLVEAGAGVAFRLGGPGDRCLPLPPSNHSLYCWSLINHMANGRNYFTKKKFDDKEMQTFISVHEKGENESITPIVAKELSVFGQIYDKYPSLRRHTLMNNEGDPEKGWAFPESWRRDAHYAALMAKSVARHIEAYFVSLERREKYHFEVLSNDNAFLSYFPHQFDQRTLTARFQVNNSHPYHVQLIKKPIYAATGLLSYLGRQLLETQLIVGQIKDQIEVITSCSNGAEKVCSVLVINCLDATLLDADGFPTEVKVDLNYYFDRQLDLHWDWKWIRYSVDNLRTNPYDVWAKRGSPPFPSSDILQEMRSVEGPFIHEARPQDVGSKSTALRLNFTLPLPGISLVVICRKSKRFIHQVKNLRAVHVKDNEVLLLWRAVSSKCVFGYEIEFAAEATSTFSRINNGTVLFPSFQYLNSDVCGFYRVRSVDFFDRKGIYSRTLMYTRCSQKQY